MAKKKDAINHEAYSRAGVPYYFGTVFMENVMITRLSKIFSILALTGILVSSGSLANPTGLVEEAYDYNRTSMPSTGPGDLSGRCSAMLPVLGMQCEDVRNEALHSGCIDEEQYRILQQSGSIPICNRIEGLISWCPCI